MDAEGPELVETGGALNVRYRGRLLYSERGPVSSAARAAEACDPGPARLHLVLSPLLWYGVPELLSRMGGGSVALCVEGDRELAGLSRECMPAALRDDPRLAFVETGTTAGIVEAAHALGRFRRSSVLKLSGGAQALSAQGAAAAATLQAEYAAYWRSKATLLGMGRLWARNIFRNLAALPDMELSAFPRIDRPAVVCGAGPSLEASLGLIARLRTGLFVVACDTSLPALLDSGIEPDLVVCLEGQAYNLADFTPAGARRLAIAADLSSHPATFRLVPGPRHLTSVGIAPSPFLRRIAGLGLPFLACPPLGSVGVHAVHVTRRLSTAPVLITGLDFAFEPGKTHGRGAPALAAELRRMERLAPFRGQTASAYRAGVRPAPEGAPGRGAAPRTLTDPALSSYAALLADEARQPGPPVLDLRDRGLPLGLPRLSAAEAEALVEGWKPAGPEAAPGRGAAKGTLSPEAPEGIRKTVQGFIDGEAARLETLYDFMKGRTGMDREGFRTMVEESDYLLWPVADAERLPAYPQDLLNRLLVEVEYWRWKLGEIRATM
jgi:hypothetical protein